MSQMPGVFAAATVRNNQVEGTRTEQLQYCVFNPAIVQRYLFWAVVKVSHRTRGIQLV
jgi:hypothetical protein